MQSNVLRDLSKATQHVSGTAGISTQLFLAPSPLLSPLNAAPWGRVLLPEHYKHQLARKIWT